MNTKIFTTLALLVGITLSGYGQSAIESPDAFLTDRDQQMRDRYKTVLERNPFQERAFAQVYDSYLAVEGIQAWIDQLLPMTESDDVDPNALILLGQIYDRQFKMNEAIAMLTQAQGSGEDRPEFKRILGMLYYRIGSDEQAIELLSSAIDGLTDPETRTQLCRVLGNVMMRSGKRDEAIDVWKRIVEQNPDDVFSMLELAEVYEDNRLWDEAIAQYEQIIETSASDPYRVCQSLRAIGECQRMLEQHEEAIASFEQAIELVSPGNWLFDDLKNRLIAVYQDLGDLEGLVRYFEARIEAQPNDVDYRAMLAEALIRMNRLEDAEAQYQFILERSPNLFTIYEKLLALYERMDAFDQTIATYETLIDTFPTSTDYIRRMGEVYWLAGDIEQAKETWKRIMDVEDSAINKATLASWFEQYEFPEEALAMYASALEQEANPAWTFRYADLLFEGGQEEQALATWVSVLNQDSEVAEMTEVATILSSRNLIAEAQPILERALQAEPDNYEVMHQLSKNLVQQDEYQRALPLYDRLASQSENEYLRAQGVQGQFSMYRELDMLPAKQQELMVTLEADPESMDTLYQLATLYEFLGQRTAALELYKKQAELEPENISVLRNLAEAYSKNNRTSEAIDTYTALIEKDSNRARVYTREVLEHFLYMGLRDEAVQAAESLVERAPQDPEARIQLAQVYQMFQQMDEALQQYRFAIRLAPDEPDYYLSYGIALQTNSRMGEAQATYRTMLDVASDDNTRTQAIERLATIYQNQGTIDELIDEFSHRVRTTPKRVPAYEELATIYKSTGNPQRAMEVLEQGYEQADDKDEILRSLIRGWYEISDYEKVRTYYEALLAMSGEPTPFEYERLGKIYSQLGEIEQAKETWDKIIASNPDDAELHDRHSKILQEEGFFDESMSSKARAIALEPEDLKRRYEYAQMLAANEQFGEAIGELQTLIEIGESQVVEEKKPASSTNLMTSLRMNQQPRIHAYMFMHPGANFGMRMPTFTGRFEEERSAIVQYMAQLAQQSSMQDQFIEDLEQRMEDEPNNEMLKHDALQVYQTFMQSDKALEVANELIALSSDSVELVMQAAVLANTMQETEHAITLLEQVAEIPSVYKGTAQVALITLHTNNGDEEKAEAMLETAIADNPDDVQSIFMISQTLAQNQKFDRAKEILLAIDTSDPNMQRSVKMYLASLAQQAGEIEEALNYQKEMFFTPTNLSNPQFAFPGRSSQGIQIYSPQIGYGQSPMMYRGGMMQNIPAALLGQMDYMKQHSFQQIVMMETQTDSKGAFIQELQDRVAQLQEDGTTASVQEAITYKRLILAHSIGADDFETAETLLANAEANLAQDIHLQNARLYLADKQKDYETMFAIYADMQRNYPNNRTEIQNAIINSAFLAQDMEKADSEIRSLAAMQVPQSQLIQHVRAVYDRGETELAQALIDETLAQTPRTREMLTFLADMAIAQGDFDKAIEHAWSAFDTFSQRNYRSVQQHYYPGMYYGGRSLGNSIDEHLNRLIQIYSSAGKTDELITIFTDRLEKQSGSPKLHEQLAHLYEQNNQRDEAIAVLEKLVEMRPNHSNTLIQLAQQYSNNNQLNKAKAIYDDLMEKNPRLYNQIGWQLRHIYQRMGRTQDLAKIEEKMVARATNPQELINLAQQMQHSNPTRAIELYRQVLARNPQQTYVYQQLAQSYKNIGDLDSALDTYMEYIQSPQAQSQFMHHVDFNMLTSIAAMSEARDRQDEVQAWVEELRQNPRMENFCTHYDAATALWGGDTKTAMELIRDGLKNNPQNSNMLYVLQQLVDVTGDPKPVLDLVEEFPALAQSHYGSQLAKFRMMAGDKEGAYEQIKKHAEQNMQHNPYEAYQAYEMLSQFRMEEEAQEFYETYVVTRLNDPNMRRYMMQNMVRRYVHEGRNSTWFDSLMEKETLLPVDVEMLTQVQERLQHRNRDEVRVAIFERLLQHTPENRELQQQLAQLYLSMENTSEAITILDGLVQSDPTNSSYRKTYTEALMQQGQRAEAIESMEAWVDESPSRAGYVSLSEVYTQEGKIRSAYDALQNALSLASDVEKKPILTKLAEMESQHGSAEKARMFYKDQFERERDSNSLIAYLTFLNSKGWGRQAWNVLTENPNVILDQNQSYILSSIYNHSSDYQALFEAYAKQLQSSEQYRRHNDWNNISQQLHQRGVLYEFLNYMETLQPQDSANPSSIPIAGLIQAGYQTLGMKQTDSTESQSETPAETPPAVLDRNMIMQQFRNLLNNGKAEEAITLIQTSASATTLHEKASDQTELARAYYKAKQPEKANAILEELLTWSRGTNTIQQVGSMYVSEGMYEEALPILEKARTIAFDHTYNQITSDLALCYAFVGRKDDALATWNSVSDRNQRQHQIRQAIEKLKADGKTEYAIALMDMQLSSENQGIQNIQHFLESIYDYRTKNWDVVIPAIDKIVASLSDKELEEHSRDIAFFLQNDFRLAAGLEQETIDKEIPWLIHILPHIANQHFSSQYPTMRSLLTTFAETDDENKIKLASLLMEENKDQATELYQEVYESNAITQEQREHISRILGEEDPVTWVKDKSFINSLEKSTEFVSILESLSEEKQKQAETLIRELTLNDEQFDIINDWLAYAAKPSDENYSTLVSHVEKDSTPSMILHRIMDIAKEREDKNTEIALQTWYLQGGFNESTRIGACKSLVEIHLTDGNLSAALETYAEMAPSWQTPEANHARNEIGQFMSPSHTDAVIAWLNTLGESSTNDMDKAHLYAFGDELLENAETDSPAWEVIETWSALAQFQYHKWGQLHEDWEVSAPYAMYGDTEKVHPPEIDYLAAFGEIDPTTEEVVWNTIDPNEHLGMIDLRKEFISDERNSFDQSVAYARTSIESETGDDILVAIGSDDWIEVWVNGESVHRTTGPRSSYPGQDYLMLPLEAGPNQILLKIGNQSSDWGFTFQIVDETEPFTLAQAIEQ